MITGGTGAVGTALTKVLIQNGIEVLVVTRKNSARNGVITDHPLVTTVYADMSEYAEMRNGTGKTYDVFFHLAWMGASGDGRSNMYLQNDNVRYSLDAVALAKRMGCHTWIGTGSQAEYGRQSRPLTPDTPVFPETGYGYAKLCAGWMTRDYAHQLGIRHIWTRILSVYGPNDWEGSLISAAVEKILSGQKVPLTAGEQIWDYVYSEDAAEALRLLAERGTDSKTYVIGSGRPRTLKNYICSLRNLINSDAELGFGELPYAEKQVMYLCADISELNKDAGWSPKTEFEEGIRKILKQRR